MRKEGKRKSRENEAKISKEHFILMDSTKFSGFGGFPIVRICLVVKVKRWEIGCLLGHEQRKEVIWIRTRDLPHELH
jgi:hypothetical protein